MSPLDGAFPDVDERSSRTSLKQQSRQPKCFSAPAVSTVFRVVDRMRLHSAYTGGGHAKARLHLQARRGVQVRTWQVPEHPVGRSGARIGPPRHRQWCPRSYVFESRLSGRTLRLTIGDRRTWDIPAARIEATRLKRLTDQGIDPREVIKEQRANEAEARAVAERKAEAERVDAQRKALLVGEAWDKYIVHHTKRWGSRHRADHLNLAQVGGQTKKRGRGLTV